MIVDRKNSPLIEAKLDFRTKPIGSIQITKTAMLKIVSSIPEDASFETMAFSLIDNYLSSDGDVVQTFNSFTGTTQYKKEQTFIALMAQNNNYNNLPGYDHKAYQADYKAKFDIINAQLLYEIKFTDSTAVEFAKFIPVSFGVEFDRNLYTLQVSDTFKDVYVNALNNIIKNSTNLVVNKIVGNTSTTVGKFFYTNRFGLLRPDYTTTSQNFYSNTISQFDDLVNPTKNQLEGKVYTVVDVDNQLIT
tara:strand:+ start:158 stop:898 length:741 start_codon:yes stop_codon:yes gene_type:complete